MSNFRITTNGVLHSYRSQLHKSYKKLYDSMTTVSTNRAFNSYAEDPAAASRAFQLRRSMWRTDDQITNNEQLIGIYNTAFSALQSMIDSDPESDTDNGFDGIKESLAGITGTAGAGRSSIGQVLISKAKGIVQLMNSQYGDNYVFAGADGLNVPFTWQENDDGSYSLLYRNVDVTSGAQEEFDAMNAEKVYVDIGLGLKEDAEGNIIQTSAQPSAISGLEVLGCGTDEDGYSQNLAVLMRELGEIFYRCDADSGGYASDDDAERAEVLVGKLNDALDRVSEQYSEISADAEYLKTNLTQLENTRDSLDEQRASIEEIDSADAITEMMWAQYCYNAALRIGNDVLSQSLLDYME